MVAKFLTRRFSSCYTALLCTLLYCPPPDSRDPETAEERYHNWLPDAHYSLTRHSRGMPGKIKAYWADRPHPTKPGEKAGDKLGLEAINTASPFIT